MASSDFIEIPILEYPTILCIVWGLYIFVSSWQFLVLVLINFSICIECNAPPDKASTRVLDHLCMKEEFCYNLQLCRRCPDYGNGQVTKR